ncbi:uncharacterized protein PFL1_00274 [Pseudozyma flocculosa PF-1]|uniref:Related to alcohol dehydrogenase n=1 Tax=Pseudozyma flocculosa TaxID=84751 RepID=A0A5C3ERS2_9BASI|nr:uncharacterized protein PFL1_00274 [Pseudozyma flocculosa PF-1]EPQ32076.1 hypothetical protein PFL1_00274 [Pseudozyma flocculosa PF-1]SPO34994.1 related to alcohol dehydrogenase [Pseudozyma flocculosa]
MVVNRRIVFNQVKATGLPEPGVTTRPEQTEIDLDNVALNGGVLVRNVAASLDPTMRNRMKGGVYFTPNYVKDEPILCIGISEVLRSELDAYKPGDLIFIWSQPLEEYSVLPRQLVEQAGRKMDVPTNGLSITTYLGAAGMAGMTAYMSIKEIIGDRLQPGTTMFVTGAAGAVGQLVVQIARQAGVKVIASAGSDDKCRFLREELGCEAVFNYKTADPFEELKKFGGERGIDFYFDNVGGTQLEAYIEHSAKYGIIVACGYISGYNADKPEDIVYPKNLFKVVTRELTYRGFIVSSFIQKHLASFLAEIPQMIADGKIKVKEDVTFGVLGAEDAFLRLFTGDNEGKVAVLIDVDHADKWNLGERKKTAKVWQ